MSRALAVIRGNTGFASGVTWVPGEVLDEAFPEAKRGTRGAALAAICSATSLDLAFIPAQEPWAEEAVQLLSQGGTASAWAISGVFGRVAERLGWPEALRLSVTDPAQLLHLLDEALHDVLLEARAGLAAGADLLVLADDLAAAAGWLMAPDFVLDSLVPCYRRVAGETLTAGAPWVFHSDGDIRAIYPVLAKVGFAAVHVGGDADVPAAMSAAETSGLAVLGGLRVRELVSKGLRSSAEELASLSAIHPLVVCDDGGISSTDDLWAYLAAVEEAQEYWWTRHG